MKLNEVLDVFGNESLEATMTPEQEFEASVESLIDEIDNVMEIRAGLEDMENGAVELAKASCESLLTGLAVREMSIANEDADLASICTAFNVKPELFGLEAEEATMKEKVKDKAGKAYSAIKNSRVAKATAAVYAKIVAFVKSFFSFDNIVIRTVKKLIAKAKGLFKKGINEGVEVQESATAEVLEAHAEAMEAVKKGLLSKSYDKVVETINALIAKIKGIEFKKPFVKSGEFIKKVLRLNPKAAEKVTEAEIKEAIKDAEPAQANKVLKAFQGLMSSIKGAFKKAISIDLKSLIKLGGKGKKSEGAAESVEFGIESLDALFGEIERVNAGVEDVEVPEEYAEIGVEAVEMFEELDAFDATISAVESVEEMYIEATIPSQIAALESIAIEKGLNPDNGVSFDLFGTMSAGIEAADEVVENASEETKKTMKERIKGAANGVAKSAKSVMTFLVNKYKGWKLIPRSLTKMANKIEKLDEDKYAEYIKVGFQDINNILNSVFAVEKLSQALKAADSYDSPKEYDAKSVNFTSESSKEEVLKSIKEAAEMAKDLKVPRGTQKDIMMLMHQAKNITLLAKVRSIAAKIGVSVKKGLTSAKIALKRLFKKSKPNTEDTENIDKAVEE